MYFRDEDVSSDKCESSDSEEESDLEFPELYVGPGVNHITSANDVNDVIQNVFRGPAIVPGKHCGAHDLYLRELFIQS